MNTATKRIVDRTGRVCAVSAMALAAAALPAGALCFVVAQNYNVYVQRTSAAILLSTLAAVITLSVLFLSPIMHVAL